MYWFISEIDYDPLAPVSPQPLLPHYSRSSQKTSLFTSPYDSVTPLLAGPHSMEPVHPSYFGRKLFPNPWQTLDETYTRNLFTINKFRRLSELWQMQNRIANYNTEFRKGHTFFRISNNMLQKKFRKLFRINSNKFHLQPTNRINNAVPQSKPYLK